MRFNWQIIAGTLLSLFAFLSYPLIFSQWPLTRDFPWVNIILCVFAALLVLLGIKKAFGPGRGIVSRIGTILLAVLSAASLALFIFVAFVMARWLPPSTGAPDVAGKAPDFTLSDTRGNQVRLADLRSTPAGANKTRGVLLVFYRGYW